MEQNLVVDLSPLLGLVAQGLIAVFAAVATWAAAWIKRRAHLEANSILGQNLDALVTEAISFAQGHLMTLLGHADFAKVETRNAALQLALGFVTAQAPAAIASLGLTEQHLSDLLLARMAKLDPTLILPGAVPLAPTPATPLAPAPAAVPLAAAA